MNVQKVLEELKNQYPGKNIEPEEYHIAKGKETWVKVTSVPGWTPEDQYSETSS